MVDLELELYSTAACHLCEVAESLLASVVQQLSQPCQCYIVDIADDDALLERYGTQIPVLRRCDSGAELCWPFDAPQLLTFLDQMPVPLAPV